MSFIINYIQFNIKPNIFHKLRLNKVFFLNKIVWWFDRQYRLSLKESDYNQKTQSETNVVSIQLNCEWTVHNFKTFAKNKKSIKNRVKLSKKGRRTQEPTVYCVDRYLWIDLDEIGKRIRLQKKIQLYTWINDWLVYVNG